MKEIDDFEEVSSSDKYSAGKEDQSPRQKPSEQSEMDDSLITSK